MSTTDINLPVSSRSGHPIYTSKILPSTTPASLDSANPQPSFEISPNGTWRSLAPHFNLPNVELLDLTSRFSYTARKNPKATGSRPKNALKKGLRPTKSFELPPVINSTNAMAATRQIYRQHSHSLDADEEGVHSEPSPSKSRLMAPKPPTDTLNKDTVVQPQNARESTSTAHKRRVDEISSDHDDDDDRTLYEITPPRPTKVPRLTGTASDPATPSGHHYDKPLIQPPGPSTPIQSTDPKGPALNTLPLPVKHPTTTTHKAAPGSIPNNSTPLPTTNTILRIYIPSSPHKKTYIPLRLHACLDIHALFNHIRTICDVPLSFLSILRMHFDNAEDGETGGKKRRASWA
ncbi:MAG: hypothetical protein LQ339_008714 [Xanthoria mediterranea]|nr:MAG: hypothetical protein LQ339_008714 [Xanthoria mediterranea]